MKSLDDLQTKYVVYKLDDNGEEDRTHDAAYDVANEIDNEVLRDYVKKSILHLPTIQFPPIYPFPTRGDLKTQALKVLEEAAELVEAVKDKPAAEALYEFCDVLQALGNLAETLTWNNRLISLRYLDVMEHNIERGRYAPE